MSKGASLTATLRKGQPSDLKEPQRGAPPSGSIPRLSSVVTLARQFQRAVRLDADYGSVDALQGYVCQGTARNVLETMSRQIVHTRQRAFTWTGPFGGGKSSLAVGLCSLVSPDRTVRQAASRVLSFAAAEAASDVTRAFSASKTGWLVLPVVGHRGSVVDAIAAELDRHVDSLILRRTKSKSRQRTALVLQELAQQAESRRSDGVLLCIDELGKFLEAAADGDDIYFYQELADVAGRCDGKLVVVGILHQSFEQYANRLGSEVRDEWRKVQGRYVDIPLIAASDEVVELIGRAIDSTRPHPHSLAVAADIARSIRHRRPGLDEAFANRLDRCWPLHPVTAALLGPVSKRRFGQNERSTFGFLASVEARSFREFLQATPATSHQTYSPAAYWDYLRTNLEPSILASPDSHRWAQGVDAVERTEQKQQDEDLHLQLVKTIALIDLFRNGSGLVADDAVLRHCVFAGDGIAVSPQSLQELLQDLRRWAVVTFKRHLGSWSISEGSDFDIDAALAQSMRSIDEPDLGRLEDLVRLQPVLAKRHYCETGTMRWMVPLMVHAGHFQQGLLRAHELCGEPGVSLGRTSVFGAFLLVLPARGQTVRQAINAVRKLEWTEDSALPILVGVPRNGEAIRELGRELVAYDQIRHSRSELENDAVARRELEARTADVKSRLSDELREALLNIEWTNLEGQSFPAGAVGPGGLAPLASTLADRVFASAPCLFSELINRDEPSSNSIKGRKDLLYAMLAHGVKERLGFVGYPAEAGLYHNLLEATGLHRRLEEGDEEARFGFMSPTEDDATSPRARSIMPMWSCAMEILASSKDPVGLTAIFARWQAPPYGVRAGVLPVLWLAFALANQQCIALYKDGMFVPQIRQVEIDEASQDPSRFALRYVHIDEHRRDILVGVSDRLRSLGREVAAEPLEAARGLVALVFDLPQWTRRTQMLGERTRDIRDVVAKASDPHKVLFVDLPILFEGMPVPQYLAEVGNALDEMVGAYEKMLSDVMVKTFVALDASFDTNEGLEALRHRARSIAGLSGDFRLDAFATRLSTLQTDRASVEGLLSLAGNKSPREWTDQDIHATLVQLGQWALQFRRVEAVGAMQDRVPTRNAIAVVFGTGKQGKTVSETFDISPGEDRRIQQLVDAILRQFKDVKREVLLAALAQTGTQLVEHRTATEDYT